MFQPHDGGKAVEIIVVLSPEVWALILVHLWSVAGETMLIALSKTVFFRQCIVSLLKSDYHYCNIAINFLFISPNIINSGFRNFEYVSNHPL